MITGLKPLVDGLTDTVRQMAEKTGLDKKMGNTDPGMMVIMDLMQFAMYLSASDGEIRAEEAEQITAIFGTCIPASQIGKYIRNNNIYSTDFEKKVPMTMQLMVAFDNAIYEQGLDKQVKTVSSEVLYKAFELVGGAMITSDNNVAPQEKKDLEIYLCMLHNYMDTNLTIRKELTTGFTKTGEDITSERMMDIMDKM